MISEQEAKEAAALRLSFSGKKGEAAQWCMATNDLADWATQELARRDWQDEPVCDGWYWLKDSDDAPFKVERREYYGEDDSLYAPGWMYKVRDVWWPLRCRVCKITERPA